MSFRSCTVIVVSIDFNYFSSNCYYIFKCLVAFYFLLFQHFICAFFQIVYFVTQIVATFIYNLIAGYYSITTRYCYCSVCIYNQCPWSFCFITIWSDFTQCIAFPQFQSIKSNLTASIGLFCLSIFACNSCSSNICLCCSFC